MFVLEGEGRKPSTTDEERALLLRSMAAYTGTYRVEGDTFTTTVDVAWDPAWHGTEQVRNFNLEGNRLINQMPWTPSTASPVRVSPAVWTCERSK